MSEISFPVGQTVSLNWVLGTWRNTNGLLWWFLRMLCMYLRFGYVVRWWQIWILLLEPRRLTPSFQSYFAMSYFIAWKYPAILPRGVHFSTFLPCISNYYRFQQKIKYHKLVLLQFISLLLYKNWNYFFKSGWLSNLG